MSVLFRKMVKEVQAVQSLVNIPAMKQERELIVEKIHKLEYEIVQLNKYIVKKDSIQNILNLLEMLNTESMLDETMHSSAIVLSNNLTEKMQNANTEIPHIQHQIDEYKKDLQKINEKIKKAR